MPFDEQSPEAVGKFREYVTSGAFKLTLSRNQVSALSMASATGEMAGHGGTFSSLDSKGLTELIRSKDGGLEVRLTEAGVFALKLVRLAGLVNGDPDPVAEELKSLRAELDEARKHCQQLAADNWDMTARIEQADLAVKQADAWVCGNPIPKKPIVTMKNKNPERTQAQIVASLRAAENFLQVHDKEPSDQ